MKLFLISLSFFTRLPIPALKNFSEKSFFKSMLLIPLIGSVIGIILFGINFLLNFLKLEPSIKALILIFCYLFLTGCIHFDGVADTVDALYSNKDKSKILAVMKDINIGTFGNISLIIFILSLYIFIRFLIFYNNAVLLIIFPIIGRFSAIEIGALFRPNRENHGLGYNFCKYDNFFIFIGYTLIILILLFFLTNFNSIISFFIIIIINYILGYIVTRRTNGVTGDILGFFIELSQLEFLLCFIVLESALG